MADMRNARILLVLVAVAATAPTGFADDVGWVADPYRATGAKWKRHVIKGHDLRDAWADVGFGPIYTYHDHHLCVKIDHILYRGDMKVLSCRRDKEGESDHYPLVAVFER